MKYKWSDSDTASGEVAAGSTWQRVTVTPGGAGLGEAGSGGSGIVPGGIQLRWEELDVLGSARDGSSQEMDPAGLPRPGAAVIARDEPRGSRGAGWDRPEPGGV